MIIETSIHLDYDVCVFKLHTANSTKSTNLWKGILQSKARNRRITGCKTILKKSITKSYVEDDLAETVKMLPKTMVDSGVCVTWWMCLEAYLRFVEIGKTWSEPHIGSSCHVIINYRYLNTLSLPKIYGISSARLTRRKAISLDEIGLGQSCVVG
jgi:hypothetical protein